jgi:hypothetical protein
MLAILLAFKEEVAIFAARPIRDREANASLPEEIELSVGYTDKLFLRLRLRNLAPRANASTASFSGFRMTLLAGKCRGIGMTFTEVKQLVERQPFRAFGVRLSNGTEYSSTKLRHR